MLLVESCPWQSGAPEGLERTLPTIEIEGVPELIEVLLAA